MIRDNPAFATSGLSNLPNGEFLYGSVGLTTRQLFAAMAMHGMLSGHQFSGLTFAERAHQAVAQADELIFVLEGDGL